MSIPANRRTKWDAKRVRSKAKVGSQLQRLSLCWKDGGRNRRDYLGLHHAVSGKVVLYGVQSASRQLTRVDKIGPYEELSAEARVRMAVHLVGHYRQFRQSPSERLAKLANGKTGERSWLARVVRRLLRRSPRKTTQSRPCSG